MQRRDFCQGLGSVMISWDTHVSPVSLTSPALQEAYDLVSTKWGWLFEEVSSIRPAATGELPQGAAAGLLIRNGECVIVVAWKSEDRAFLASLLVHEAWHAQMYKQGRKYYGSAAEQECLSLQALCLSPLNPTHPHLPWLWRESTIQPDNGPLPGNPIWRNE